MIYLKRPFYGYRRIAEELKRNDHQVNRKRVRRIMHNLNIRAIYPKLNLSIPNKQHKKYPYLLSGMRIDHVNQVWASDITYLRLKRGVVSWYLLRLMELTHYFAAQNLANLQSSYGLLPIRQIQIIFSSFSPFFTFLFQHHFSVEKCPASSWHRGVLV